MSVIAAWKSPIKDIEVPDDVIRAHIPQFTVAYALSAKYWMPIPFPIRWAYRTKDFTLIRTIIIDADATKTLMLPYYEPDPKSFPIKQYN